MAEGLLRHLAGDRIVVESAGVAPSDVREEAVKVMTEVGIDISSHRSKSVDEFADKEFDYIITVCDNAKDSCPAFPGTAARIHWSLKDPAEAHGGYDERLEAFRTVRDQIRERLIDFVESSVQR